MGIYYSSQFAPLIVFFLLFLSIVKNTKVHHFVRFNAMQVRAALTHILHSCIPESGCQALAAAARIHSRTLHRRASCWTSLSCCSALFAPTFQQSSGGVLSWSPLTCSAGTSAWVLSSTASSGASGELQSMTAHRHVASGHVFRVSHM